MMNYKKDILFALKIGICSMIAASLLLMLSGLMFNSFSIIAAVSVWRSGMCIISGLLLLLVGAMILFKRKMTPEDDSRWRIRFKKLNYSGVIGIIAVMFVIGAVISDYLLLSMK